MPKNLAWGGIAGDLIGSPYEFHPTRDTEFPLFSEASMFTDDTVLSVATMDAILLYGQPHEMSFEEAYRKWAQEYPLCSYGARFRRWMSVPTSRPYNSFGNGAAMRAWPIGLVASSLQDAIFMARESAGCTHDHPEGFKGAVAAAGATFLARTEGKAAVIGFIEDTLGYRLGPLEPAPKHQLDETCMGTIPDAIQCFLLSEDWEGAVRKAILLRKDADTLACIAGGIAGAYYGVPNEVVEAVRYRLDGRLLDTVLAFQEVIPC